MKADPAQTDVSLESLLADVVDEITQKLNEGVSVDIDVYIDEYPELGKVLPQVFEALAMVRQPSVTDTESEPLGSDFQGELGDFRLIREIGRGGMGVVYEAEQISLRRRMALKVLPFAAMLDKQQLKRFKNEARAAATLEHPRIVAVHSVGEERGVHYYAMQLVEGQSLAELIAERRKGKDGKGSQESDRHIAPGNEDQTIAHDSAIRNPQSAIETRPVAALSTVPHSNTQKYFRTVARLGVQAAEALEHAHQNGIVHRDVKPGNLLVDAEGKLYVTDFGLARIETDAAMTMTGDLLGTLAYMSPEQALAKRLVIDHRTDIYSLGVTLYELLTLEKPYEGQDRQELLRKIAFDEPGRLRQINRQVPEDLETIVAKAIEKNPDERYETARELANDLQAFLDHRNITAKPPTLLQRTAKWSKRHVGFVWTAAAVLLLGTVITTWLVTRLAAEQREVVAAVEAMLSQASEALRLDQLHLAQVAVSKAHARAASATDASSSLRERIDLLNRELSRYADFEKEYQMARWARTSNSKYAKSALDIYEVMENDDWGSSLREVGLPEVFVKKLSEHVYEMAILLAHETILWSKQKETDELKLKSIKSSREFLSKAVGLRPPTKGYYWVLATCSQRMGDLTEGEVRKHHDTEALRLRALAMDTPPQNAAELWYISSDRTWGCADGRPFTTEREPFRWPFKDTEDLLSYFRAMLRVEPDYYNALFFMAHHLSGAEQWESAVHAWTGCLVSRPDDWVAQHNRADALFELGRHEECLLDLQHSLTTGKRLHGDQPKGWVANAAFAHIHHLRGKALSASGNTEEARESLQTAISICDRIKGDPPVKKIQKQINEIEELIRQLDNHESAADETQEDIEDREATEVAPPPGGSIDLPKYAK